MGRTQVVPEGTISLQRPCDTILKQANTHCIRYIKLLSCAVVVLAALCIAIIGVLSWHITQSVGRQDQKQESVQAITEHNHDAMKYLLTRYQHLEDANLEMAKMFKSHVSLIRSVQMDMRREQREVETKFNNQGNIIETNGNKIEEVNDTVISICSEDIRKLEAGANGFANHLINLQQLLNANVNILQKLQEDIDVHTVNITNLQEASKTCSDVVENLLKEVQRQESDLDIKKRNLTADVKPMDCEDLSVTNISAKSGIFRIFPTSILPKTSLSVYCDMVTQGGGWIVIQRRQDGSEDFYRDWQEYKRGFGKLDSEFWLGLDNIHALMSDGKWELLINMRDDRKGEKYAMYKTFSVGPESAEYALTVGDYSGDAGDSLTQHNGMKFSTKDKDNDIYNGHCAVDYQGAWWYKNCQSSNLNGVYGSSRNKGPRWNTFTGTDPAEFVEMKIKRKM